MTEPIAVDVPGKPAFARSLPGPMPTPAPLPKADAPKPELPKPPAASSAPPAPTPGTATPKVTPPPSAPAVPGMSARLRALLARVGKRRAVVAASAVFSLAAGVAGVRLMFPATDEPTPATTAELKPGGESGTPAPTTPAVKEEPPVLPGGGDRIPPIPIAFMGGPAEPLPTDGNPPSTIKPTTVTPAPGFLPPPALEVEQPKPKPTWVVPPPSLDIPVASLPPLPGGVIPTGGAEPKQPPTPTPTPSPVAPLPTPPTGGSPALPPLPAVPPPPGMTPATPLPPLPGTSLVEPKTPAPPAGLGMGTGMGGGTVPPPVGVEPTSPAPLPPKLPDVTPPAAPKLPDPVMPVPPAGGTTGTTPGVLPPIDPKPTPKTDVKPPPPTFDPPAAPGTPTGFTKPAGSTEVKPSAPEVLPKTSFDVDVYEPKAGDSYETISQEFYNDKRFAAALKAFNRNQSLQGGRMVEVPPIHILKRQFSAQAGATPAGGTTPSAGVPDWSPAGGKSDPTPIRAAGGRTTFVVPPGGMSMRAVARLTLGSDQRWPDVYALNPQFRSDEVLPAGTELKLPADARLP
jgi:hypothetical protein